MPVTQKRLKQLLRYSPEAGVFEWRSPRHKVAEGALAGCVNENGYLYICLDGEVYRAHHLAWLYVTGLWPETEIDHADGDKLNNLFSNLRLATRAENCWNAKLKVGNTSGVKGVSLDKRTGQWDARIRCNGKQYFLGSHRLIEDAAAAVAKKRKELHGEYARDE